MQTFSSRVLSFVLFASALGVAGASASALPGDLLYNVKVGVEDIRLSFSQDPLKDAELLILFADKRLEEVSELLEASRNDDVPIALAGYEDLITDLIAMADDVNGFKI